MDVTIRSKILLVATTGFLWVVPSIGTQGMETVGQRVTHPDASLFDRDDSSAGRALAAADHGVEASLGL